MAATIRIQIDSNAGGSGFADAQRGLRDLDDAARKVGGGFSAAKEVVVGALREIGAMAVQAGVEAARAIGGFVADSVQAAGTFEASINGLAAVTGSALADAGFSLDDVSQKALQLGKDTQFSAQEAIQAMTELAKGGVPIQSVMTDATDATLALAAAAGVNLPNAAEIVAKQLGVWSETGVSAAQVTDLLASAANASTVGVEDLALGLAQAGGTAKTAGVSFNEMVTTMAMIAPNFASASDAGTSFKTFLARLIPTTEPAKAAMAELGLYTEETGSAFYDARGQFIGMEAAAELLQTATAGLTEEQRLLAFQTIFGADAIRAAAAIANAGAEGYTAMGSAMEASGGAAAAAAVKQQGYAFAMEQFQGSVETAQIILGSAFLPILTQVITGFTEGVNAVAGFIERFQNIPAAIAASDNPLRTFLNAIGIMIPGAMPYVQQLITVVGAIGPVVTTIAAQAVAGFQSIVSFVQANGPTIGATVTTVFQNIWSFIQTVMPAIQGIVQSAIAFMQGFWTAHGATIVQVWMGAWQAIQGILQVAFGVIQGLMAIFAAAMTGDTAAMNAQIQASNELIWTGIRNFLEGVLNGIAAFFGTSLAEIRSTWDSNLRNLPIIAKLVMDNAIAAFRAALAAAPAIGRAIIDGIKSGLQSALGGLVSAAANAARSALDAAKRALGIRSPSAVFADEIGEPIADGLAQGILDGTNTITTAAESLAQQAVAAAQGALAAIGQPSGVFAERVGKPIAEGLAQGITTGGSAVASAAAALAQQAVGGAQSALAAVGQSLLSAATGDVAGGLPGGGGSPMVSAAQDIWGRAKGGGITNNRSTTNNFTMNVRTNASASTLASDFNLMRALAGAA